MRLQRPKQQWNSSPRRNGGGQDPMAERNLMTPVRKVCNGALLVPYLYPTAGNWLMGRGGLDGAVLE